MLVVLVTFSRLRRYIVSQTTVPRQLKTICSEFTTGYELLMRHRVVCVEYAIRLAALPLELPSDLGQVSVGEEQHRTRLYELSNLERVSMCAHDVYRTWDA